MAPYTHYRFVGTPSTPSRKILTMETVVETINEHMPETFTTLLLKNKLRGLGYSADQWEVSQYCLTLVGEGALTAEVCPNWETFSDAAFNIYTKVQEEAVELEDYIAVPELQRLAALGIDISGIVVTRKIFK